jgi:hypothetical protein
MRSISPATELAAIALTKYTREVSLLVIWARIAPAPGLAVKPAESMMGTSDVAAPMTDATLPHPYT